MRSRENGLLHRSAVRRCYVWSYVLVVRSPTAARTVNVVIEFERLQAVRQQCQRLISLPSACGRLTKPLSGRRGVWSALRPANVACVASRHTTPLWPHRMDVDEMGRHEIHRMRRKPQNESWADFCSWSFSEYEYTKNHVVLKTFYTIEIQSVGAFSTLSSFQSILTIGLSFRVMFTSYSRQSNTLKRMRRRSAPSLVRVDSKRRVQIRSRATGSRRDVHVAVWRHETLQLCFK